jgi:hypothetical protein
MTHPFMIFMNDKEILLRLLQTAYTDDALEQPAKAEFEKFVIQFDEVGAKLEFPLNDLDLEQEKILRSLSDAGYTTQAVRYHGTNGGHILHVNLRGEKFLELANGQVRTVVFGMQDSGKRETFESGAVRDTAVGKSRPDLISPFATEKLAHWLRLGAEKYSPRNWEKGIPLSRCLASAQRHLLKYQQGAEDGEDHLAAAYCNIMFMIHTVEMIKRGVLPESLDDLPRYSEIPRVHFNGDEPID